MTTLPADAPGRGAFTERGHFHGLDWYTRLKGDQKDGHVPEPEQGFNGLEIEWFRCVRYGVVTIQKELHKLHLLDEAEITGLFGWKTRHAVENYQRAMGIEPSGMVGGLTMGRLLRPYFADYGGRFNINPKWIYGVARQESNFDPGAQGAWTPDDRGIFQFNTSNSLTVEEAFDFVLALDTFCRRWKYASRRYDGKGTELRVDCCIIQHRSPVAADYQFEHGEPYGPESAKYISDVRNFAEQW